MKNKNSRRQFMVKSITATSAIGIAPLTLIAEENKPDEISKSEKREPKRKPPLNSNIVFEFVRMAHFNLDRVKEMLALEPKLVNAAWDWGAGDWETGLGGASHVGNRNIARYLLSKGSRKDIFCASMLGETDVVEALVNVDSSIVNVRGPHGYTLLYHVASSGNMEMAKIVELHLNEKSNDFNQALRSATRDGHLDMVSWLLENGVTNPNELNFLGKTPLKVAIEKYYPEIAAVLRKHGAIE